MPKIKKNKITKFILGKIKDKVIVKCPNCKTKFFRSRAQEEFCNVCMTTQTFIVSK